MECRRPFRTAIAGSEGRRAIVKMRSPEIGAIAPLFREDYLNILMHTDSDWEVTLAVVDRALSHPGATSQIAAIVLALPTHQAICPGEE